MSENKLIEIKQLPIIEERFKEVSSEIEEKISNALSLPATEENLKIIKQLRATLNKEFGIYEEQRKDVKSKILKPYNEFNDMYEKYIGSLFKHGNEQLKEKVTSVENIQKQKREQEVRDYFNEYKTSHDLDFITYEQANINVTLTASMKSLKEQAKAFIDKVIDDIQLINLEEHREEILVEYKQTLNASKSIITVKNRLAMVEKEKQVQEEMRKYELDQQKYSHSSNQEETILQAPKIENVEKSENMTKDTEEIIDYPFRAVGPKDKVIQVFQYAQSIGIKLIKIKKGKLMHSKED